MYLRRAVLFFVILFGVTLWTPFSAHAVDYNFCVPNPSPTNTDCPGYSAFSSTCKNASGSDLCVLGQVSPGMYEHCCQSAVDPCSIGGLLIPPATCNSGEAQINSCGSLQSRCVPATSLTAPSIISNGGASCGVGNAGTCQSSNCDATTQTPDTSGDATCATADPLKATCCKPTTPPGPSPSTPNLVTTTVGNPLAFSTVEGILGSLLGALQGIIVVLALISIIIGGILYITSAGNDERMKTAKGAITAAAIGLALGLAAPSFLKQIGVILGWGPTAPTVDCPATLPSADLATCQAAQVALNAGKPLSAIALSALQFLLSVVGVLGIIMLVIGGLTYITSAGNEERSESGKKIVMYAIIGIAIALASLVIVTQIAGLFVP